MGLYFGGHPMTAGYCGGEVTAVFYADEKVWPQYDPAADWLYVTDGESAALLLYLGTMPFVTIPSEIGGYPVTALAPTACCHAGIRSVRMPACVTKLG